MRLQTAVLESERWRAAGIDLDDTALRSDPVTEIPRVLASCTREIAVSVLLSLALAQNSAAPEGRSLDWPGQITAALGLFALLYAVIQGPESGWGSPQIVIAFIAAGSSVAYLFFGGIGFVLSPLTSKLLERHNPRWVLFVGPSLIGVGGLWFAGVPASDRALGSIVGPLILAGIGSGLGFAAMSAVAVNSLPIVGMASGATSTFRDLGFAFGPAIAGAVALGQAAKEMAREVAGNPGLSKAYAAFQAAPAHAPADRRPQLEAAVHAVASGPLGANSVPPTVTSPDGQVIPFNPLKDVAFHALSTSYSHAYVLGGVAALVAAALTLTGGRCGPGGTHLDDDPHTLDD